MRHCCKASIICLFTPAQVPDRTERARNYDQLRLGHMVNSQSVGTLRTTFQSLIDANYVTCARTYRDLDNSLGAWQQIIRHYFLAGRRSPHVYSVSFTSHDGLSVLSHVQRQPWFNVIGSSHFVHSLHMWEWIHYDANLIRCKDNLIVICEAEIHRIGEEFFLLLRLVHLPSGQQPFTVNHPLCQFLCISPPPFQTFRVEGNQDKIVSPVLESSSHAGARAVCVPGRAPFKVAAPACDQLVGVLPDEGRLRFVFFPGLRSRGLSVHGVTAVLLTRDHLT